MDIRIDLSQLGDIAPQSQVGCFHLVGAVRDYAVKALGKSLKSPRLAKLIEGLPVTGSVEQGMIQAQIEAHPVPAIPARQATAHYPSGKTGQVTIDASPSFNVIRGLAMGRGAVFPVVKKALIIGIGSVAPSTETYLSVSGVTVDGFEVPGQNYILRQVSKGVAPREFINEAVEDVNQHIPDLAAEAFAGITT